MFSPSGQPKSLHLRPPRCSTNRAAARPKQLFHEDFHNGRGTSTETKGRAGSWNPIEVINECQKSLTDTEDGAQTFEQKQLQRQHSSLGRQIPLRVHANRTGFFPLYNNQDANLNQTRKVKSERHIVAPAQRSNFNSTQKVAAKQSVHQRNGSKVKSSQGSQKNGGGTGLTTQHSDRKSSLGSRVFRGATHTTADSGQSKRDYHNLMNQLLSLADDVVQPHGGSKSKQRRVIKAIDRIANYIFQKPQNESAYPGQNPITIQSNTPSQSQQQNVKVLWQSRPQQDNNSIELHPSYNTTQFKYQSQQFKLALQHLHMEIQQLKQENEELKQKVASQGYESNMLSSYSQILQKIHISVKTLGKLFTLVSIQYNSILLGLRTQKNQNKKELGIQRRRYRFLRISAWNYKTGATSQISKTV